MKHYLYSDLYDAHKAHHVSIDDEGQVYYNLAMWSGLGRKAREDLLEAPLDWVEGTEHWYDTWQEPIPVQPNSNMHNHQAYIDRAWREHNARFEQFDGFSDWRNQGLRDFEVLAVIGDEALAAYEMPNGRVFLNIVPSRVREIKEGGYRAVSLKGLPKKWREAADMEYVEEIYNSWSR